MTQIEVMYIFMPPLIALLMAGVIVWGGNRRTARLDAQIARYRAQKACQSPTHRDS